MQTEYLPIFVYGTLKRGEVRERMWPRPAVRILKATTSARLYDLGPYPALIAGDETIGGELWFIAEADLPATLETLDRIECYGVDDVDLYVRTTVDCRTSDGGQHRAYTYFFADPSALSAGAVVRAGADGVCRWNRRSSHRG